MQFHEYLLVKGHLSHETHEHHENSAFLGCSGSSKTMILFQSACKPAGPPPNIGRLFVRVDVFFHLSFWSVIIIASVCVKSVVSGIIFLEPFPLFDPIKFFTNPINNLFA